ncbi:MAG: hypothetical protein R3F29_03485 [Planctomycetota bacterium]
MVFLYTPGKALGCNVNAHRNGWNGTVCSDATNWSCSAEQVFRDDYCMRGDDRCYHVNLFANEPRFRIDDNGIGWMLQVDARALDDQILLIWGGDFGEPRGLKEHRGGRGPLYGAYRVKTARKIDLPYRTLWEVVPHVDGWTRCHNLRIPRPTNRSLAGKYMREIDRSAVVSAFEEGRRALEDRRDLGWFDQGDERRFRNFVDHLGDWLDAAGKAAESRGLGRREPAPPQVRMTTGPSSPSPLAGISSIVTNPADPRPSPAARTSDDRPSSVPNAPSTPTQPASPQLPGLPEPDGQKHIAATYGQDTLLALRIAAMTKALLILRGNTGVGKSHLALRLLDDPKGERTLVVPVSATWRGREDLLGYVNPLSSEFEPTPFTRFLFHSWQAWQRADQRPRLVVFEEFNLSQPEHWLSDLLVVSQYDDPQQRRIQLGGKAVRGIAGNHDAVPLSPALHFVATINNDHTTRPLSPRVVDRAAIVELDLAPSEAVRLAGAELDDEHLLPITELDELLRTRGASFSLRSARSLAHCLERLAILGIGTWQAIDLVLVQEVLSKVRLLARDPGDAELLRDLQRWSEKHGRNLARCSRTLEAWSEALDAGLDVIQA